MDDRHPHPVTDQRLSVLSWGSPSEFADGTVGHPERPLPQGEATYADGRIRLPRPIAFVLGGGGSLGAIQVGQLQALAEYGIRPDLIVGTSIGSINGAVLADDPLSGAARLAEIWPYVNERDVLGGLRPTLFTFRPGRPFLATHDSLARLIQTHLPDRTFNDLEVPFAAVTFEATSNRVLVFDHGPLEPALLASCSIPGIFPPVELGDKLLYDGGIASILPVRQAMEMGARSVVVLDCMFPGTVYREPSHMWGAIMFFLVTMLRQQAVGDLAGAVERAPVIYLPGPHVIPPLGALAILDFTYTNDLMAGAYETSHRFLAEIQVDGSPAAHWPPLHNPG